ncbi:hypothetical protein [Methylacidiphilum caldifontis]|uniref:Uncharacterized protein n=1 Tax=Methylacidiphilum caldifontis TaxID=2795386 RepID=A0A4Y8PAG4_9BACT|nr:hypothetical protein [Methylacidiphilum caldifontis]QSR89469.1 hypothetical protein IT6_04105 [Methylacidiphilum caldifontis]TFE67929.1 hypothetical protein A7Q10_08870 [Methylacidiphilum caldifontis]
MSRPFILHVRFGPDGQVMEIAERPQHMTPQQWFSFLWGKAGDKFQALSGGRGIFRLPVEFLEELKKETLSHG